MTVETRRSACNRDCPDACGLVAEVEDGRIRKLTGDREHPVTRGFLCFRTSHFPELLDAPHRLTSPQIRRGDELVPASWDEALDFVADRLQAIRAESGPEAIFHYRSGGSLGLLKHVSDRFFEEFGPCASKSGDICSGAGEAAQLEDFGVSDSNDLFDLRNARHVIMWGKNPFVSNVHLVPLLKEIRAAGTQIHNIDPIHHRGVSIADHSVHPAPGRDPELALGVARALFDLDAVDPDAPTRCDNLEAFRALAHRHDVDGWAERAGVSTDQVLGLARALADGPTAILVGWGMQRRQRGGATVRLLDALSAVSGNLWRSGGGCSFYFKRRGAFESPDLGLASRKIREPLLGDDVLAAQDPPIRAMWVTAGNPVCMLPDSARVAEAIEATELVVVVDSFLTDTARRADVVLPVPTLLEDSDLVGSYGHHWIAESRPLVDPPEGVLHEVEIFARLASRVGVGTSWPETVDDWKRALLRRVADRGASLEDLRQGAVRNPEAQQVLFGDGRVQTPNGRVQLIDDLHGGGSQAVDGGEYPLWLFSNSTEKSQASQWARGPGDRMPVTVHPDAVPGIADGDHVVVENARGSVPGVVRHDSNQRVDVVIVPKGGHYDRGHSANSLIPAAATDLGLGAAFLDCHVRIRPA